MNEQILMTILGALISSLAQVVFAKILNPYIPDRKKLNSYIKNFLRFTILYALPIASIIWLFLRPPIVDKYFVLAIAFNFFALSIHFSQYIYSLSQKNLIEVVEYLKDRHRTDMDASDNTTRMTKIIGTLISKTQHLEGELNKVKKNL